MSALSLAVLPYLRRPETAIVILADLVEGTADAVARRDHDAITGKRHRLSNLLLAFPRLAPEDGAARRVVSHDRALIEDQDLLYARERRERRRTVPGAVLSAVPDELAVKPPVGDQLSIVFAAGAYDHELSVDEGRTAQATLVVPAPVVKQPVIRINITMDKGLLDEIDRSAKLRGFTRSGFLAEAARHEIAG